MDDPKRHRRGTLSVSTGHAREQFCCHTLMHGIRNAEIKAESTTPVLDATFGRDVSFWLCSVESALIMPPPLG